MTGELTWGLKASLRRYVENLPDGSIVTSGGASRNDAGEFRFPLEGRSDDGDSSELRFTGSVTLSGHGGLMRIALGEPRVVVSGDRATLSVLFADTEGERRINLATMTASGSAPGWTAHPVRLTAAGADALGALQYYKGQPVDDIIFSTTR